MNAGDIREHMTVHARGSGEGMGASGVHVGTVHVGTVDEVEGNFIKLTKSDSPDGQHHWIPLTWVTRVDEGGVYLSKTSDEFRQGAMTQNPDADMTGAGGGVSGAAGIEQIGRASPGRDADLAGNAPGSGGVTIGNIAAGDPGPAGTMDDGNGGMESGGTASGMRGVSGTGVSNDGNDGLGDVSPGGLGAINPKNQTGNLGGTMSRSSGQGAYLSAGADSGGNLTTSADMESISGDANGEAFSGASAGGAGIGSAAASGHLAGGTGSSYGDLTDGEATDANENNGVNSARLPSAFGGTVEGQDSGAGDSALSSAGGSMLSDAEIGATGAASPMGDRDTTGLAGDGQVDRIIAGYEAENRAVGPGTDEYVAEKDVSSGTGDTTSDRKLMSGAGGASGDFDDRNANTGASGNVSDPNGLPGQGTTNDASGKRGNE